MNLMSKEMTARPTANETQVARAVFLGCKGRACGDYRSAHTVRWRTRQARPAETRIRRQQVSKTQVRDPSSSSRPSGTLPESKLALGPARKECHRANQSHPISRLPVRIRSATASAMPNTIRAIAVSEANEKPSEYVLCEIAGQSDWNRSDDNLPTHAGIGITARNFAGNDCRTH